MFRAGLLRNRWVLVGITAELGLLLALILLPPLRHVFGLAPLGLAEWGLLLLFPPAMLLLEETRKLAARRLWWQSA
ncbi:MAG: cation transporting ATPase C-terminal domain-containing protein [Candidatus Rokubacteria bacterium]|nr:cation transporting ATPase C-terminal domain-containing protein [Candidatus Rokubacteria bacterium]